jgi:mRNA-degrading endonuclease RelE of RelBE toxin-antitoxin system
MMRWTLRYSQEAVQGLYKIPRGKVARVTAAIAQLMVEPRPPDGQAVPDRPNTFSLFSDEYIVTYELIERARVVKILKIEVE